MVHPLLCYLGVGLSFVLSFALFVSGALDVQKYFYAPVFLLIVFYTVVAMVTDKQDYQKRSFKQVFLKSIGKYVLWGSILAGIIWFYNVHPAYKAVTPNTRIFFKHFFYAFGVCGLPYFCLEEKYRYCKVNVLADSYIKIALLIRCLLRMDFHLFRRRLFSKKSRGMLLSAILRIHYIPIMIEQVYIGVATFTLGTQVQNYTLLSLMFMITTLAWLIDSNNASIGYFWQSSFTKTRFREVDPHPSHWIVVLACYPPFIYFLLLIHALLQRLIF